MRQPNPLQPSNSKNKVWQYLGLTVQLGLSMALSVLLCFYVAWQIEQRVHSGGIILALGVLVGVLAGGWTCYRTTLKRLVHPEDEPTPRKGL